MYSPVGDMRVSNYVEWCDDAAANLRNEIKTGETKQEELEATISKCKADIEANNVKIEELSGVMRALVLTEPEHPKW